MKWFRCFAGVMCGALLSPALSAAEKTTVRLILSAAQARPGSIVWAGVELRMPPQWHTYWRNAGDSGMATKIDWQLPNGITAGEIQWPLPAKLIDAELTTYVYHNSVLLLTPLQLADRLERGPIDIKAEVSWLECEKVCLPGGGKVKATLTVGTEFKPSTDAPFIENWKKKLPVADPALAVQARWEKAATDDSRPLLIEWIGPTPLALADFFPDGGGAEFEVAGATDRIKSEGHKVALRKIVKKFGPHWPPQISGLIVTGQTPKQEAEAKSVVLHLDNPPEVKK